MQLRPILNGPKVKGSRTRKQNQMTITRCPHCQRHCFTDATECQECGLVFEPGLLNRQSDAKERRFVTKSYVLFAGLLLIPVVTLLVVQIYDYRNGTGLFGY